MTHVLSCTNLRKVYPKSDKAAVDAISFHIKESEILGLLGPNGSGKTTTIQMLLGTLSVTSGSISYFGKDFLKNRYELLQYVSFASAYTSLPWLLRVEESLKIFGRFYGLSPKESEKNYSPLLDRFGILEKRTAPISSLSAGQITRLMLVKAFFIQPKIVLLDEPTASLDPEMANGICKFILEERDKKKMAILFTSHKMDEISEVCDRVIFLKDGNIISDDIPKNLAKTISSFQLRLVIVDGMKRTLSILQKRNLSYKLDHRTLDISIAETDIPSLLTALHEEKIIYSHISIDEPSLEDYFLQIAKSIHRNRSA